MLPEKTDEGGHGSAHRDPARRILTEELHYDPGRDRIWSDSPAVLLEGDSRLEGSGFEATGDLTEVEVLGSTTEGVEVET